MASTRHDEITEYKEYKETVLEGVQCIIMDWKKGQNASRETKAESKRRKEIKNSIGTLNLDKPILDIKMTMTGQELNDIIIYCSDIKAWSQAVQDYYIDEETNKKNITGGYQLLILRDNELFVSISIYSRTSKLMIQPGDQEESKLIEFLKKDFKSLFELRDTLSNNGSAPTTKNEYEHLVVQLPPISSVLNPPASATSVSFTPALTSVSNPASTTPATTTTATTSPDWTPPASTTSVSTAPASLTSALTAPTTITSALTAPASITSAVNAPATLTSALTPSASAVPTSTTSTSCTLTFPLSPVMPNCCDVGAMPEDSIQTESLATSLCTKIVKSDIVKTTPVQEGNVFKLDQIQTEHLDTSTQTYRSVRSIHTQSDELEARQSITTPPAGYMNTLIPIPLLPLGREFHKKLFIVNEVLCYIQNKMDTLPTDTIVKLCSDFFTYDDIRQAKSLLYQTVPVDGDRLKIYRGEKKAKQDVKDIIMHLHMVQLSETPIFLSRDITMLPPQSADSLDNAAILRNMESMMTQITLLTEAQKVMSEMVTSHIAHVNTSAINTAVSQGSTLNLSEQHSGTQTSNHHTEKTTKNCELLQSESANKKAASASVAHDTSPQAVMPTIKSVKKESTKTTCSSNVLLKSSISNTNTRTKLSGHVTTSNREHTRGSTSSSTDDSEVQAENEGNDSDVESSLSTCSRVSEDLSDTYANVVRSQGNTDRLAIPKVRSRIFHAHGNSTHKHSSNLTTHQDSYHGTSGFKFPQGIRRSSIQRSRRDDRTIYFDKRESVQSKATQAGLSSAPGLRAVTRYRDIPSSPTNRSCTGVFVTRLKPHTTASNVESYIKQEVGLSVKAEKLPTRYHTYSSFYIPCSGRSRAMLTDGTIWPKGSLIKPFFS